MFTPGTTPEANRTAPDKPTSVDGVAVLICQVLCAAPNKSEAVNTFNSAFSDLKTPQNLAKLYNALPEPNLQEIQGDYNDLAAITTHASDSTLCPFAG